MKVTANLTCLNCSFQGEVEGWPTECPRCGGPVVIERLQIQTDEGLIPKIPPSSFVIEQTQKGSK